MGRSCRRKAQCPRQNLQCASTMRGGSRRAPAIPVGHAEEAGAIGGTVQLANAKQACASTPQSTSSIVHSNHASLDPTAGITDSAPVPVAPSNIPQQASGPYHSSWSRARSRPHGSLRATCCPSTAAPDHHHLSFCPAAQARQTAHRHRRITPPTVLAPSQTPITTSLQLRFPVAALLVLVRPQPHPAPPSPGPAAAPAGPPWP